MDSAPVQSFTSLSSLMDAHLEKQATQFNFGSSTPRSNGDQTGHPSLMSLADDYLSKASNPSLFMNLGSFGSSPSRDTFIIPQLFPNLNSTVQISSLNTKLSDLKLEEAKTSKKETQDNCDDWEIDLSQALITTNINNTKRVEVPKPEDNHFVPEFISCEPEIVRCVKRELPILPCLFSDPQEFPFKTKRSYEKCTIMGKIICKQFRNRTVPYIEHKYHDNLDTAEIFRFDVPSPDELILARLEKQSA